MKMLILSFITLMLVSCSTSKVQKISELEEFDEGKFLGKWYEIGRIDYFFQKNIINSKNTHFEIDIEKRKGKDDKK